MAVRSQTITGQEALSSDLLISLIYKGVTENKPWQSLADELCTRMNAMAVAVVLSPGGSDHPEVHTLSAERGNRIDWERLNAIYASRYRSEDPMGNHQVKPGEIVSIEHFRNCPFYTDFLKPAGIEHSVRMGAAEPNGLKCWVSIAKSRRKGPISTDEIDLLERLLPHLEQALAIFSRMMRNQVEKDLYKEAIERLHLGSIVLDGRKTIISTNRVAEKIIREREDISVSNRSLRLANRAQNLCLQATIDRMIEAPLEQRRGAGPSVLKIQAQGVDDLAVFISPISSVDYYEGEFAPRVIVYLSDLGTERADGAQVSEELLGHLLNLSKRESRLMFCFLKGFTLRDAAIDMAISEKTARNHLNRIYEKTGVHRQADLVRLVYKSGIFLVNPSLVTPEAGARSQCN